MTERAHTLSRQRGASARESGRRDRLRAMIEGAIASLVVAGVVLVCIAGLWRTSEQELDRGMRNGLMQLAGIAASTIDPELHDQLHDAAQIDTPLYDAAIAGLRRACRMTPGVKYMYTIVHADDAFRFVLDAAEPGDLDVDGREDRAQVWEEYDHPDAALRAAIGDAHAPGHAAASLEPHVDEWGSFMTGYAPILDSHGRQVGVAGVDVAADAYFAQRGDVRRQALFGLVPGAILTLTIGLGAYALRRRQLISLRAAERGERRAVAAVDRLAESEHRFRALADSAPMLVWSADALGHCDFVNKPWCDFTGRSLESELGDGRFEAVHPEDRESARSAYLAAFHERRMFLTEYRLRRADGAYRLILDKGVARRENDAFAGYIGAGLDITDLRGAELEMKRAIQTAQAADRAKSEFLANMSHEIRTPITTIIGYSELLRTSGDAERAPPARLQALRAIQTAGEHLLTIINDVLDLSKIEAGCMRVERVETELSPLLRGCFDLMSIKAQEKGLALDLRFDTPVPSRVVTDPTRLRQILLNLLSNAVKFTPAGSVTMRCRCDGAALIVSVEDTGVGLDQEQAAKLFQSFSQADATITRTHGGTGLGLAICRRLATLMGGSVVLSHSQASVGSCFTVRVTAPATADAVMLSTPPRDGMSDASTSGFSSHQDSHDASELVREEARTAARIAEHLEGRVLLVEDGPDNRRLIAFHLEHAGACVSTAENGVSALARIDADAACGDHFDLIVTDLQMPEMDGITLARTLRARGDMTPIIALTANEIEDVRDRCLEAGCNDFACKPIDRASMLAVCRRWLGSMPGATDCNAAGSSTSRAHAA